MSQKSEPWTWELGFVIFFGIPIHLAGYYNDLKLALLVHFALIGCYTFLLLFFGRGSVVEMGVIVTIISINISILLPVPKRLEQNRMRHQMTVNKNANHR